MRVLSFFVALSLAATALAAPVENMPLRSKDPLSIHRRSDADDLAQRELPIASGSGSSQPVVERAAVPWNAADVYDETDDDVDMEDDMDFACAAECAVQQIHGAKNEREALCSIQGLKTTLACAKCIDATWPDTSYEDSAVAEYERIKISCEDDSQRTLHAASL